MPYIPANLQPTDYDSADWALAQVRLRSRDRKLPELLTDDEWMSYLTDTSVERDFVLYFRPHEAAAVAIETDPERLMSEGLMSSSVQYRDPAHVAAAIRRAGKNIDIALGIVPRNVKTRFSPLRVTF